MNFQSDMYVVISCTFLTIANLVEVLHKARFARTLQSFQEHGFIALHRHLILLDIYTPTATRNQSELPTY